MDYKEAAKIKMPFGKHVGKTFEEIMNKEPWYIKWLAEKGILNSRYRKEAEAFITFANDPSIIEELKS